MPGSCLGKLILDGRAHQRHQTRSLPHLVRDGGLDNTLHCRSRVVWPERGKVANDHLVSLEAPDFMYTTLSGVSKPEDSSVAWLKATRARLDGGAHLRPGRQHQQRHYIPGAAGRDAGSLAHAHMATVPGSSREPQDMRRTEIVLDSGKVLNSQIVSVNSPDFFKQPFENAASHFEARRQRLQGSYSAALLDAGERTRRSGKKMGITLGTGKVMNGQMVSVDAPDFFKEPCENNSAFFEQQR